MTNSTYKHMAISLLLAAAMVGCNSNPSTPSVQTAKCASLIKYSGYKVEVTSLKLPIADKTLDIGKIFVAPEKVQEAYQITQALDVLQFNQCQTMIFLPADQRLEYAKLRDGTIRSLSDTLLRLSAAKTQGEYDKAVADGKKTVESGNAPQVPAQPSSDSPGSLPGAIPSIP